MANEKIFFCDADIFFDGAVKKIVGMIADKNNFDGAVKKIVGTEFRTSITGPGIPKMRV